MAYGAELVGISVEPDLALWNRSGRYGAQPQHRVLHVPEPASLALLGIGAMVFLGRGSRQV